MILQNNGPFQKWIPGAFRISKNRILTCRRLQKLWYTMTNQMLVRVLILMVVTIKVFWANPDLRLDWCRQGWIPPRLQRAPSKDLSISSSLIFNLKCLHTTEISSTSTAGVKCNIFIFVCFSIRFPGWGLCRRFSWCVSHVYIIVLKTTNTNAKSSLLSRIRRAIN